MIRFLPFPCIALVLFLIAFIRCNLPPDIEESRMDRSGAFEALSFFGQARHYPAGSLPPKAFFQGWKQSLSMQKYLSDDRSPDPWQTMGPHNRGGRTLNLAFNPQNPNTLYAGSASGGLWRSYTGGIGKNAWEQVPTGFPVLGVSSIVFAPHDSTRLWIGTGEVYNYLGAGTGAAYRNTRGSYGIGILYSQDGGTSWELSLDFTGDPNKGIWDIEVSPSHPEIIYAATTDGVYATWDGGKNWSWILDVVMATDLVVHPENPDHVVVACGNFSSPGYGIYRTTNGGTFWHKITTGLPSNYKGKTQLALAPSSPDILYASIGNGFSSAEGASWLCRSNDFGLTWSIQNQTDYSQWQGWFSHDVAVHPQNPDEIIVIGISVWKSTDAGNTLELISEDGVGFANPPIEGPDGNPNFVHSDCHDILFHPQNHNIFYVANDGGIHRSTNGGENFSSCNGRYQTAQFYNGFTNSSQDPDFCQGGLQDNGTIQWNGAATEVTWTRVNGGDGGWTATHPLDDNINFVSSQFLNVRRTLSGNTSYSGLSIPSQSPVAFIAPYAIANSNGQVLYAGSSVIARSDNMGSNWYLTNNGNPLDGNPALSISISSYNEDVVYVGTAPTTGKRGNIFLTVNGGNTWQNITGNLPDRYPMDVQVDPTDEATAYVAFSGYGTGHVFRTNDFGESWVDVSVGLPDMPANAIEVDPSFPNNVYVGTDLGIYVSTNYGETWMSFQDGLPEATMVFDLRISPANRKLRAATHGSGAFQRDLLEEPIVNTVERKSPDKIQLIKLFPNPASEDCTLTFTMLQHQKIRISLINVHGKRVREFLNGYLMEGEHSVNLGLNGLPEGVYYVKLDFGADSEWRKLIIL